MGKIVLDGHKLAWHGDRVEAWLSGRKIAPLTIDCALTWACTNDLLKILLKSHELDSGTGVS